jgi:hypothetical protein
MTDEVGTFTYTLLGREMRFKLPHQGQIIILQRMLDRARRHAENPDDGAGRRMMLELSVQALELIESLFLEPADAAAVEKAMLRGELDFEELMPILGGGRDKPQPVKKMAKKAAKATKKTANPRRVAR